MPSAWHRVTIKSSSDDTDTRRGQVTLKMCHHSKNKQVKPLTYKYYLEALTKQNFLISSHEPTVSKVNYKWPQKAWNERFGWNVGTWEEKPGPSLPSFAPSLRERHSEARVQGVHRGPLK